MLIIFTTVAQIFKVLQLCSSNARADIAYQDLKLIAKIFTSIMKTIESNETIAIVNDNSPSNY